jgi:hypothetical protein
MGLPEDNDVAGQAPRNSRPERRRWMGDRTRKSAEGGEVRVPNLRTESGCRG